MTTPTTFAKDPAATLDYAFDWSSWLAAGDTITSATVTADTGLTVVGTPSVAGSSVTAWLAGGEAGSLYRVTCKVITEGGRTDERTMQIEVTQR